ncbi:uncharacterized protein [Eurosta solidaginis]|uniref:uncharacterized protein n=1 Tax=Eurosta solidaginis TaxID=178769 RepID=UPI0035314F5F
MQKLGVSTFSNSETFSKFTTMQTKLILLFLSALLLVQTRAIPRMRREAAEDVAVERKQTNTVADSSDSSSSEESGELKKARQILMTETLVDLVGLAKYLTERGQPLLKKSLEQLEALPEKSPELQANMTRIADFLKKNPNDIDTVEGEGIMSLLKSMIDFTDIMKDLDDMPLDLAETHIILKAFADSGAEKFLEDFISERKVVIGKFEKSIERYLGILSEKQKARETKLINWYTNFTNEKDEVEKAKHYANFFDTFKPGN